MKKPDSKRAVKDEFSRLYDEHRDSVFRLCLVKLKNNAHTADDCTQNTFTVLYKKLLDGETIEYPKAFLYKTAQNFILKSLAQNSRIAEKTVELDIVKDKVDTDNPDIDDNINYELMKKRILEILNDEEKKIFKLRYIDDLTLSETADRLQISKAAVAKRVERMRKKIINSYNTEWKGESYDGK